MRTLMQSFECCVNILIAHVFGYDMFGSLARIRTFV